MIKIAGKGRPAVGIVMGVFSITTNKGLFSFAGDAAITNGSTHFGGPD
jgi:hypothetical protein